MTERRRITIDLLPEEWRDLEQYAADESWSLRDEIEFILRTYQPPMEIDTSECAP